MYARRQRFEERMNKSPAPTARVLPNGMSVRNKLLTALPDDVYAAISQDFRSSEFKAGEVVYSDGVAIADVYFPDGGVFSVTNQMQDGALVEVATVGFEGMLGVNVFLGDRIGTGQTLLQVPNGPVTTMAVDAFLRHALAPTAFRDIVGRYTQAHVLQIMQSTACNALHDIEQRCCRWLLQTHDRVAGDEFILKQEFLASMLGTARPSVTVVMGTLQRAGLIASRYGKIRVLDRANLESAACECYAAIRSHYERLGL
jgi:CRP-like cAMP-binding protein